MMTKTGGKKTIVRVTGAVLALMLAVGTPALAAQPGQAPARMAAQQGESATAFLKDVFTATIDVMNYAARTTSDTVHHNIGNVMGTAAKARGFVRDTVSGVLGNARKVTGMVGDVMPFTEHNHYEGGAKPKKAAE